VKDVSSSNAVVLLETASVEQALSLLRDKKINRIPLVSKKGELAGLFSFSDMLRHVAVREHRRPKGKPQKGKERAESVSVMDSPVKEFASSNPETIRPTDSLSLALQKMREKNVSSLVVNKNGAPFGILTLRDLLKLQLEEKNQAPTVNVQFSNKPPLDEIDSAALDKKVSDFVERFSRKFSSEIFLQIHCKSEKHDGIRKKHSIKMHLTGPGLNLISRVDGWKFLPAVHDGLRALETEAEKKKRK
jgi:CBS domain-containing protein/ribosome-associated translation inhibitor RaiA